ncbi:MAG: alpha/beta fold hydrolase [Pseudomonadota bacterium]
MLEVLRQIFMGQGHVPGGTSDDVALQPDCQAPLLCSIIREERIAPNQPPPVGTFFFPGAGFDGGYINDFVVAMDEAGIDSVNSVVDNMSFGTAVDALSSAFTMREDLGGLVSAQPNLNISKQFNLVGYSYGSLVAAQTAAAYARGGNKVDNLVLVGSPISADFLAALIIAPNVRKVIIVNLTDQGDPIEPGMSQILLLASSFELAYQMIAGEGHFYYAPLTPEGNARRRQLAAQLYDAGLR